MNIIDFYKRVLSINLNEYNNIDIDLEINKLLLCLVIGVVIATCIVNYQRSGCSLLIRRLIRFEAYDPESSIGIEQLDMTKRRVALVLRSSGRISRTVARVGEEELTYEEYIERMKDKKYREEKIDFSKARFYIRSEKIDDAKRIAEAPSPTLLSTVLFCILTFSVFVCISLFIPEILSLINEIIK